MHLFFDNQFIIGCLPYDKHNTHVRNTQVNLNLFYIEYQLFKVKTDP